MKKNLMIAFIFAVGIVCGISFSQLVPNTDQALITTVPEQTENTNDNDIENNPPPKLTSAQELDLYQTLLPSNSPFWLELDLSQIESKGSSISDFLVNKSVQPLWDQMISNFPKGATAVFETITETNENIRIYASPPDDEGHVSLVIAGQPVTTNGEKENSFDLLTAALPDASTREAQIGNNKLMAITTPMGEILIAQETHLNWYATDPIALENIFNDPPSPPEDKPVYQNIKEEHEDAIIALVLNSIQDSPLPLPIGLEELCKSQNIDQAALVMAWPENSSRLFISAHTNNAPDWATDWQPIDDIMFSVSDPVGIVEGAIQWPDRSSNRQESQPNRENERRTRQQQRQNEGLETRNEFSNQLIMKLIPQNYPVGINFFGFYRGNPSLTFAMPELPQSNPMYSRLEQIAQASAESIEITNLPGKKYVLKNKNNASHGLDQLIVIERDNITYLFDNLEAAQNYLSTERNIPDRNLRKPELRNLYDKTTKPSQIKILLTTDFYEYVMNQELQFWKENETAQNELKSLFEDIKPHLTPVSISAGFNNNQWFMEQYCDDKLGLLIGNTLLLLALYRFM